MQYSFAILALVAAASANPLAPLNKRQGVTASIAPAEPAPPGCTGAAVGSYAIIVQNITTASPVKRQVTQIADGQAQVTHGAVAQIGDGQIQAGMQTKIMMPIANQINDGQIQVQTTLAPVAEFKDGQPQAPTMAMATPTPVSEAPAAQMAANPAPAAPAASPASNKMVTCATEGNLEITLENNILKDSKGRTGYIASNFQFQFDAPPQSESIFTAGFSFCGNGSLALGGSNIFYQCLSGDFYNLYDRHWAQQCNAVTITVVELQQCQSTSVKRGGNDGKRGRRLGSLRPS